MADETTHVLWLDRFAAALGFERLDGLFPGTLPPSYLYAIVVVGVSHIGLNLATYALGYATVYEQNPFFVLQPLALIGSVYASRTLTRGYKNAMTEMSVENRMSDPETLTTLVPRWLPWAFFVVGAGFGLIRAVFAVGIPTILQESGVPGLIAWFIVNPFVYAPIAAQFLAVFLSLELVAPVRLARSDLQIDFMDPEGLGGLRPIGELLKSSYYFMMVGLVAFVFILYAPVLGAKSWSPTSFTNVVFTATWVVTVAAVAFAVFVIHRFMHREKREEMRNLNDRLESLVENRWDIKNYTIPDGKQGEVDEIQQRMDRVSNTNEYPATFTIWTQLLLSIAIPKAIQLGVTRL